MKNQSKNFLEFESEQKLKSNSLMASAWNPCPENLTEQYLVRSAEKAQSWRVNTPTDISTKICANLGFDIHPSFECRLMNTYITTPFPIDGELLQYRGIKSIRVEVEGFSLISSQTNQEIHLQPGRTYEYPFNDEHFFIAFRRQGVYPVPTVYLILDHSVEGYTLPSTVCIDTRFNANVQVNVSNLASGENFLIDMPVEAVSHSIGYYGMAFEGPID